MNGVLLDTHVWIWYAMGSTELSTAIKKSITEVLHQHQAYLASISLWEIGMLDKKNRITLGMPYLEWINKSIETTPLKIANMTPEIIADSCHLPGEFHAAPADCLITATARVENLKLFTRDERILAYGKQNYVSTVKI